MRSRTTNVIYLLLVTSALTGTEPTAEKPDLYPKLREYLDLRATEFDRIPDDRKAELKQIAHYVQRQGKAGKSARVTFICTHNSRRSHMSQIWAATAAGYYDISNVEAFSGGTEATAFNPRAIAALTRAGFVVETVEPGKNPRYGVRFNDIEKSLVCYSKVYTEPPNPKNDFCAVLTCSQADKKCPKVEGCSLRVAIPYDDPKIADDTPNEAKTYDERCEQICREMLYVFSLAKN